MVRRRAAVVVAAAVAFSAGTETGADASVPHPVPWTEQTVFALGLQHDYVAEWMGSSAGWTVIGGPASKIYAGSAGVFATNPSSGDIFEYDGTPGDWTLIGGPGAQFAEGGGHLYGIGPNGDYVAEWNGTGQSWTVIGGAAAHIYAGPDGLVATAPAGSNGDIWHYNGTPGNWTDIGGPEGSDPEDIAVGAGAVYRIDPPNAAGATLVDEWTGGTTWTTLMTASSSDRLSGLIAGDDGVYLCDYTPTVGEYLAYQGAPNLWSQISTFEGDEVGVLPEVESTTHLYAVDLDKDVIFFGVELYSGSGDTWTQIGGQTAGLASGD
ncbi:MAG TPA: hypothetical protein VFN97_23395 [Actinospica sp.]|nr:hypothetical protein [Actinospica sp.]